MSSKDGRVTARKPARRRRDLSGFDDSVGRDAPIVEVTVELVDGSADAREAPVDAPFAGQTPPASGDDPPEKETSGQVVDVRLVLPPGQ